MSFPVFKNAIKHIPVAEREMKLEELKFQWKKIKMKLEEGVNSPRKREGLVDKKKQFGKQIRYEIFLPA